MSDYVPVNESIDPIPVVEEQTETVPIEPQVSAGAQLAALREARGWTPQQIASQMNLASRQIQALESDDYAALPGMVIVRGFIRGYAKVLRVDPAPILAAIKDESVVPNVLPPERKTLSASFSETKLLLAKQRGFPFKAVIGVFVLLALGLLAFAVERMGWTPASSSAHVAKIEEKLTPIEPVEVESPAVINASEEQRVATIVPASQSSVTESSMPEAPLPQPSSIVPARVATPTVTAPIVKTLLAANAVVPIDSKNALAVQVHQDSWLEIRRADNSIIVSRLLKAGSSEVFAITGPVSVVIGNATGVSLTLRGKPVDVVTGDTSNVARLNLK